MVFLHLQIGGLSTSVSCLWQSFWHTWTLMALMPMSRDLRRFSVSFVSMMMGMPGTRFMYQAAATLMARSFLSLGLSFTSALM